MRGCRRGCGRWRLKSAKRDIGPGGCLEWGTKYREIEQQGMSGGRELAGRSQTDGWEIDRRWITWTWQGEVAKVIAELAARKQELGLPTPLNHDTDGDTSPRCIVSETLTYMQNQQSRMNYPAYRKQGLPETTA